MEICENYSLKRLNTFGIEVNARRILYLHGDTLDGQFRFRDEVEELLKSDFRQGPYMIIGEGSNIVFTRDYEGTLIKIGEAGFQGSHDDHYNYLTVGARMLTDEMIGFSVGYKYYGAENLSAIPGTIGAAVVQNVGAYGVEMKNLVEWVEAVDLTTGQWHNLTCEECAFGYRTSLFKQQEGRWLIGRVRLRFAKEYHPNLTYKALADELQRRGITDPSQQQVRDIITELRWSKLPRPEEMGSAGSFFKNPVVDEVTYRSIKAEYPDLVAYPTAEGTYKLAAGWLIERAGWKGRSMGRCGVYDKQALVLVNLGGCTGQEVLALADAITADIQRQFGVTLEKEAIIV